MSGATIICSLLHQSSVFLLYLGSHKRSHSLGDKEIRRSPPSPAPEQPFRDRSNTLSEKPALPVIRDKYKDLTGEVEVRGHLPAPQTQTHFITCFNVTNTDFCVFVDLMRCCRRANAMHTSGKGVWKMLWRFVGVLCLCVWPYRVRLEQMQNIWIATLWNIFHIFF